MQSSSKGGILFEVMCFGDSNTWGYSPITGQRFPRDTRWTGVLQRALDSNFYIIEEGLSGRTTVWEDQIEGDKMGKRHFAPLLLSHAPLDLVIIMLGTNDLKKRFSAHETDVVAGVGVLLDILDASHAGNAGATPPTLLVAPPPLGRLSIWAGMFEGGAEKSIEFGRLYGELARNRGCYFLDAGAVIHSSDVDGVHFDEGEHRKLGLAIAGEVKRILAGSSGAEHP
jgi:lysophospholipase L1-like esterase